MTTILTLLSASHIVQGIIVGGVLAFLTANIVMCYPSYESMSTRVREWQPGTFRAAILLLSFVVYFSRQAC